MVLGSLRLTTLVLVGALSVSLGAACPLRPGRELDPSECLATEFADVAVRVQNDNYYDATIYAASDNTRERLGVVGGLSTETFRFRWKSDRVYFVIQLLAVGSYASDGMTVNPGDELELRVRPDLHRMRPSR